MTIELWLLTASIILGLVHIFAQAQSMTGQRGIHWNAGPRDEAKPPLTGPAGRLERALRNFLETFPLFAAAVLIAAAAHIQNGLTIWGAVLYFVGRVVYLPLYAFGVSYVRSFAWTIAFLGIVLLLAGIVMAGVVRAG